MVGCMALGAALLVRTFDMLLGPSTVMARTVAIAMAGSCSGRSASCRRRRRPACCCWAPFLVADDSGAAWALGKLDRGDDVARSARGPRASCCRSSRWWTRTVQLALADKRVYEEAAAAKGLRRAALGSAQPGRRHPELPAAHSPPGERVRASGRPDLSPRSRLAVDRALAVGIAFVVFAAEVGVVASRYYLPPIALAAFVLARSAVSLGSVVVVATGLVLIAVRSCPGPGAATTGCNGGSTGSATGRRSSAKLQRGGRAGARST